MTALLNRGRRGEALTDLDVIDLHGHLGRYQFAIPDHSPAGLVAVMDRVGVRTIVCAAMGCIPGRARPGNDEVLAAMRAHPGRIEGYVTVPPAGTEQVAGEVSRRLEEGFVGIKLHNANEFAYTDEAYAPALAAADERRMPVLLHTWGNDEEFEQVRKLAADYPHAALLLAHAGAEKPGEYVRLARDFENVYLDTSLSAAPRGLVARLAGEAGADKVVYGSDAIFLDMTQQIGKVLGANISDDDKRKVLSENAKRLLERIR